jgi:hypothetical protein
MLACPSLLSSILFFGITLCYSATIRSGPAQFHPISPILNLEHRLLDQSIARPRLGRLWISISAVSIKRWLHASTRARAAMLEGRRRQGRTAWRVSLLHTQFNSHSPHLPQTSPPIPQLSRQPRIPIAGQGHQPHATPHTEKEKSTYPINTHSRKCRPCHHGPILWIVVAIHQAVVVCVEQRAEDGEDHNGEDGDDDAGSYR